jgi:hypothetical protein
MSRLVLVTASILILGLLLSACSTSNNDISPNQGINEQDSNATEQSSDTPTQTPQNSGSSNTNENKYSNLEIITLLPKDAIPAIDNPQFLTADEADEEYAPDELILGVEFNGDARAYSINLLSSHEIVNDTVGDVKISVTW